MQSGLMAMCIFFLIFTTTIVFFRLGCQIFANRRVYWDDVWIIVALVRNVDSRGDCGIRTR